MSPKSYRPLFLRATGCAFVLPSRPTSAPVARQATVAGQASASAGSTSLTTGLALGALGVAVARARKSAAKAFENELGASRTQGVLGCVAGVQAPLGYWDPAGLASDGDAREFYRRRVVEIKHGRVAMLACRTPKQLGVYDIA